MSSTSQRYKTHHRLDFKPCKQTCPICDVLNRNGSKTFSSSYSLKYHLSTEHDRQDEIDSGITKDEVFLVTKAIETAIEWNMLLDLPRSLRNQGTDNTVLANKQTRRS